MNQTELATVVAQQTVPTKTEVGTVVDAVPEKIQQASVGDDFGFGAFLSPLARRGKDATSSPLPRSYRW